jgi:alanyl-tRNA synthetase
MLLDRLGTGIVILGTRLPEKCQIMVKISDDWIKVGFSANELIKLMMPIVDGSGGGKPQMAQGGGKNLDQLPKALITAFDFLKAKVSA